MSTVLRAYISALWSRGRARLNLIKKLLFFSSWDFSTKVISKRRRKYNKLLDSHLLYTVLNLFNNFSL